MEQVVAPRVIEEVTKVSNIVGPVATAIIILVLGAWFIWLKYGRKTNGNAPVRKAECREELQRQHALNEKIFDKLDKIGEDVAFLRGRRA